jgi:sugar phosphate isomerase/epimerase
MNLLYAAKRWIEPEIWGQQIGERWGLRYAQFCFDLLDPRSTLDLRKKMCAEIKNAAQKYNFVVHSCLTGSGTFFYPLLMHPYQEGRDDAVQWCKLAAETSEMMGAIAVGGPLGAATSEDYKVKERFTFLMDQLAAGMRTFAEFGAQYNQEFVIFEPSNLEREGLIRLDFAEDLFKDFNRDTPIPVYFMLDVGHQCSPEVSGQDSDPYIWLEKLGKYSPIVHIQQTDGVADRHWPFTKEFNEKGIIKFDKVLNSLEKSGLKEVWIFPEFFYGTDADEEKVLSDIDESIAYLKKFI